MKPELKLSTYAKINLTLDVCGKRADGYHDVRMVMHKISLCDTLCVTAKESGISLGCNLPYLPIDEKNLAHRAALLFFEKTKISGGAEIFIEKRIPVGSGMAGGSGNAAGVLHALNGLYNAGLSDEALCEMGVSLGADVPFCLLSGAFLAEGIGELLTPASPLPSCHLVVAKPPFSVSTPQIYAAYDSAPARVKPDTKGLLSALSKGDLRGVAGRLLNVFEPLVSAKWPVVAKMKEQMLNSGALGAAMSGSGPTVFGIFEDESAAKACYNSLKGQMDEVFLCRPVL